MPLDPIRGGPPTPGSTGRNRRRRGRRLWIALGIAAVAVAAGCIFGPRSFNHTLVTEQEAAEALAVARKQLGSPYKLGGRKPPAFDSSGIITWSYKQVIPGIRFQINRTRTAPDAPHIDIYTWNFHPLPLEEVRPGDLIYITDGSAEITHGAMFVRWIEPYTLMEFLDASTRLGKVVIQDWPVPGEKRGQRFVAAGRLKVVR